MGDLDFRTEEEKVLDEIAEAVDCKVDQIISLLERIAKAVETKPVAKGSKDVKATFKTAGLVSTYCDFYKARYGAHPQITGKDSGILVRLLKTVSPAKLHDLLQAYLQIDDAWFLTKCHDLPTFEANLNRIKVALELGTQDPHSKRRDEKIFGGGDGKGALQKGDDPDEGDLGREELSGRETKSLLGSSDESF